VEGLGDILRGIAEYKEEQIKPRQIREILPMERWLDSEYYVGPSGMRLYPYWKEALNKVFNSTGDTKITEVIVTGGLGTGKSSFALYCMLRKVYEISCYENAPVLFGLMPNTQISLMYFTVTREQAPRTGFGQFRSMLDETPYFQDHFQRSKNNAVVEFPRYVYFVPGSNDSHMIGAAVFGSILDEANFFRRDAQNPKVATAAEFSRVSRMYTSIIDRARSRFLYQGIDNSLSVLVSSNTTESSFTENRIKAARDNPHSMVINARLWEVRPEGTYSSKKFHVFLGSDLLDPMVVDTKEDLVSIRDSWEYPREVFSTVGEGIHSLPVERRSQFIDVPEDFRNRFDNDVILSLQNIAGVSVAPVGRLFSSMTLFKKACETGQLMHPFTRPSFIIATGDSVEVKDYLRPDYAPFLRNKARFIHIDQSLSGDSTGFAVAFVHHYSMRGGMSVPVIAVDIMLCVEPPKHPRKISISKIRDFVLYMRDELGYEIGYVSYDSYASQESLQALEEARIPCGFQSVDRTDTAYLNMVSLFFDDRLLVYDHPVFRRELFELIHYRDSHKCDHLVGGSKDVTDAVAGAIQNVLTHNATAVSDEWVNISRDTYTTLVTDPEEVLFGDELFSGTDYRMKGIKKIPTLPRCGAYE